MKRQVATLLATLCLKTALLTGYSLELNLSYDYFRGIPDGSWNGNNGAFIAANGSIGVFDCAAFQLGGSYGFYSWDGRGNLVFENPKRSEQQAFVTVGGFTSFSNFNFGLVYDVMFTKHFSIYALDPTIDQLRLKTGYQFCSEEFGVWGTIDLNRAHEHALGIPLKFKAIGQVNLFWDHYFDNYAKTSLWVGVPYRSSLRYPHGKAGNFVAGFSFRAPLCDSLFIDGHGSYMRARTSHGVNQSRNYGASISVGLTYLFTDECPAYDCTYLPLANNSNFLVDTNFNQ